MNRLLSSLAAQRPRYGYGRGHRELWTKRHRDAEHIRRVLRRAGIREFGDGPGFSVEVVAEEGDGPFLLSYAASADEDARDVERVMATCTRMLIAQGWRVDPDIGPDPQPQILEVRRALR